MILTIVLWFWSTFLASYPCEGLAIQQEVYKMRSAPQSNNMEMDHSARLHTFYSTYREPVIDHDKIIAGQSFVFPMIFEWKVKKIWAD